MQNKETSQKRSPLPSDNCCRLRLYVTGASPNSIRAIENIKRICEKYLTDTYELEIVDVYQQPALAKQDQLVALPMLIKLFPLPVKRWIGDLSDESKILMGLKE